MNMQAAIRKVVHGVRKERTGIKRQYDTLYRDGLMATCLQSMPGNTNGYHFCSRTITFFSSDLYYKTLHVAMLNSAVNKLILRR